MNHAKSCSDASSTLPAARTVPYERMGFSWGAVLAGLAVAVALNVFFAEIALSMNFGIIDRSSDAGAIAATNGIAWIITGLLALAVGAWVAGYASSARTHTEGGIHGVSVWAAGAVVMLVFAFTSAGLVGGGMLSVVGKGLEGAAGVADAAIPSWDTIKAELEGAVDRPVAKDGAAPASPETSIIDRSRLFDLAGRHFTFDADRLAPVERTELVTLLAGRAGISKEVAERTLVQWESVWTGALARFDVAKAKLAKLADEARHIAMVAAAWAAVAMLLGIGAAVAGGSYGAQCRVRGIGCGRVTRSDRDYVGGRVVVTE